MNSKLLVPGSLSVLALIAISFTPQIFAESYTYDYYAGSLKFDTILDDLSCDSITPNPTVHVANSLDIDGMDDHFFIILGKTDSGKYHYMQIQLPDNNGIEDKESYLLDFRNDTAKIRGELFQDYDQMAIYLETNDKSQNMAEQNYKLFLTGDSKNVSPSAYSLGSGQYSLNAVLFQSDRSNWLADEVCAVFVQWKVSVDDSGNITPGELKTQVGRIYPSETDSDALAETDKIIEQANKKQSEIPNQKFELPSVYQIPYAVLDKQVYTWGDSVNIHVVSPLDNKDSSVVETLQPNKMLFPFAIHTDSQFSTLNDYSLVETGPDTGIFEGQVMIVKHGVNKTGGTGPHDGILEANSSTKNISVSFEIDSNTITSYHGQFTHDDDPDPPQHLLVNRTYSVYPAIQFHWTESTSPYDANGIVTVNYPSQNKSPVVIETIDVHFYSYDDDGVYAVLTETDPDSGLFEGMLSVTTRDSFTKLTLSESETTYRSVGVKYLVNDELSQHMESKSLPLVNLLKRQSHVQNNTSFDSLELNTDKQSYLPSQPILVFGKSSPDDIIHVIVESKTSSMKKFKQVQANENGSFDVEIIWADHASSGSYDVHVVSTSNDQQKTKHIMIVSLEDLESRSFLVPPKQQFEMGIPYDQLVCKQVWKPILKPGGEYPACVELPTYHKLLERGWMTVSAIMN
ncbi:hypothetical protein [Nitrosarchaeum sp. AC2]|uniref:hypothetical protein n=1 Tax=Nitrosarchaeum sp. AC2 TaxID=2259673 RepID=UPI0015C78268|nr:hypothetical protein [Nitrosarchaeum sp. AC2]